MKVFVISQQGVYRHSLFGAYDDFELARSEADRLASEDCDHYHDYEVLEFEMNKTAPWEGGPQSFSRHGREAPVMHTIRKKTA